MHDVPLAEAVIAANRGVDGAATVIVLPHGDAALTRYEFTAGAGEDRWTRHAAHRLGFVYETMWFLAHVFAIPTATIHSAVQAIPEYRDLAGNDLGRAADSK